MEIKEMETKEAGEPQYVFTVFEDIEGNLFVCRTVRGYSKASGLDVEMAPLYNNVYFATFAEAFAVKVGMEAHLGRIMARLLRQREFHKLIDPTTPEL